MPWPGDLEMPALGPGSTESELQPSVLTRGGRCQGERCSRGRRGGVAGDLGAGGRTEGARPPQSAVRNSDPRSANELRRRVSSFQVRRQAAGSRDAGQRPGSAGCPGPAALLPCWDPRSHCRQGLSTLAGQPPLLLDKEADCVGRGRP
ncbi:hypothetical protein HJG60_011076 [Phyllostomus discolor]|uniref:Uncharacterized protein n=1 Tax=Phyllostomus discolor TaxID=89673 RepID=A0A834E6R7_9CHIR|nr:hypothetical protein HJG60_011076 [Phyllostomus discolor]